MAEYTQRGIKKCPACKTETTKKTCPNCGRTTIGTGLWTVRFRFVENNKVVYKRLSDNFKTKKEAEQGMHQFLEEHNKQNSPNYTKLIFDDVYKQYIDNKKELVKISSVYTLESRFNNYIIPYFSKKDLLKLTKINYFEWIKTLQSKLPNARYYNIIIGTMNNFLNWCEQIFDVSNLINKLPNTKKKLQKTEMSFYDYEQWKKFEEVIQDDILFDTLFSIQYYMGHRIGETIALSDSDIDFENNVIHISKSLTRKVKNKIYEVTTPKNNSSYRDVSMPKKIKDKLQNYLSWKKENGLSTEFLFGGSYPLSDKAYASKFKYYADLAKLPIIRIHDLRHSHASLLINQGANVMLVAKRLGHTNPTETLNRYAKLFKSAETEIINKIDNL